jgi:hypothetical protein
MGSSKGFWAREKVCYQDVTAKKFIAISWGAAFATRQIGNFMLFWAGEFEKHTKRSELVNKYHFLNQK